ncbi:MAG TPA: hypothetical protein VGN12_29580 [Pirellulales bacterium]|jgi:hypothetical protein
MVDGETGQTRWSRPTAIFLILAIVLVSAFTLFDAMNRRATPPAVSSYRRGRTDFENAVAAIAAGTAELRADNQGFVVDPSLRKRGVTYVRQSDECVVFYFESLPPDAIAELIYSPHGFQALLIPTDHTGRNALLHLEKLDECWFYWVRD